MDNTVPVNMFAADLYAPLGVSLERQVQARTSEVRALTIKAIRSFGMFMLSLKRRTYKFLFEVQRISFYSKSWKRTRIG